MGLTREQIAGAQDLNITQLEVPEWKGSVGLRQLSMLDIERLNTGAGSDPIRRMLGAVTLSIVDDVGKQLYTLEDMDEVAAHNPDALKRIATRISDINGWAVPIPDLEKNSASGPTVASSSV